MERNYSETGTGVVLGGAAPFFRLFLKKERSHPGFLILLFSKRNASSNFLQPVLNVSRVCPLDLEPLGGDFDSAKNAVLRTNSKRTIRNPG